MSDKNEVIERLEKFLHYLCFEGESPYEATGIKIDNPEDDTRTLIARVKELEAAEDKLAQVIARIKTYTNSCFGDWPTGLIEMDKAIQSIVEED